MVEHTAGPWRIGTKRYTGDSLYIEAGEDVSFEIIGKARTEANARLIAVAPELLALCKLIYLDHSIPLTRPVGEALASAIAKATSNE